MTDRNLNEKKRQVLDLEAQMKEQDEKWRGRVQDYEQQIAAMMEHQQQQAVTHKLEVEQLKKRHVETHQQGHGTQHAYRTERKPNEHHFQINGNPQWTEKLKDEPKKRGYGT